MKQSITIILFSENKPGVLYRIADIFLRRKINIESLVVYETKKKGTSRFAIEIIEDEEKAIKITRQLEKIVEVIRVSIHKKDSTSRNNNEINVSAIKKMELLARSQDGVVSLAQGIPSFYTEGHIRNAAKKAIDANLVDKYSSGYGIQELREAMASKVRRDNDMMVSSENILVTHGGMEGLMATFLTLLDSEDEVIVPTPDYASHLTQITIATHGGKPVYVPLRETVNVWELNGSLIEEAITPLTKAILICNPSNPIGKVYKEEELREIAEIARKHNLFIISDEMYEYFVFDGQKHISIGSFKDVANLVITIFGVSKTYAMTGWRIGYIVASKDLIEEIFKVHDSLVTCPTVVSQYAALAALTGSKKIIEQYRRSFEYKRKIVIEELSKTKKLSLTRPQGAYYAFPKINLPIDDVKLSMDLMKEAKVALVPGSAFGKGGEGHMRISFGGEEELLREGLKRLVKYINTQL